MAAPPALDLKVTVKVRGMWKVALLGWLARLHGVQPIVYVRLVSRRGR